MVFTQRVPKELVGEVAPLNGALSESALASLPVADFGLYLHVPFCNVRCGYCDFNTYTSTELRGFRREDWANSIGLELDLAKRSHIRIATKYTSIASNYFSELGIQAEAIKLNGSIEIASTLNLCDFILDLVSSGKTLIENDMTELRKILDVSSYLAVNRTSFKTANQEINQLIKIFDAA